MLHLDASHLFLADAGHTRARGFGRRGDVFLDRQAKRLRDKGRERRRENRVRNAPQRGTATEGDRGRETGEQARDDEIRAAARMDRQRAFAVAQTFDRFIGGLLKSLGRDVAVDEESRSIRAPDQSQTGVV